MFVVLGEKESGSNREREKEREEQPPPSEILSKNPTIQQLVYLTIMSLVGVYQGVIVARSVLSSYVVFLVMCLVVERLRSKRVLWQRHLSHLCTLQVRRPEYVVDQAHSAMVLHGMQITANRDLLALFRVHAIVV